MDPENYFTKEETLKLIKTVKLVIDDKIGEYNDITVEKKFDSLRDELNGTINYIKGTIDESITKKLEKIIFDVE